MADKNERDELRKEDIANGLAALLSRRARRTAKVKPYIGSSTDISTVISSAIRKRKNISAELRESMHRVRAAANAKVKESQIVSAMRINKATKKMAGRVNFGLGMFAPTDGRFGFSSMPNVKNNAYNHALSPFLMVQEPKNRIVNGMPRMYTPDKPWVDRIGRVHKPEAMWAPPESGPRLKGLSPTSSCFEQFYYYPITKIMLYKFRGGDKMYQKDVSRATFNRWITSNSLGKFYNAFVKGKTAV